LGNTQGASIILIEELIVAKLVPIELEDGMVFYIEAQEDTETAALGSQPTMVESGEQTRGGQKGIPTFTKPQIDPAQSMKLMQNTIRTYAYYCMTAFKNFGAANVNEVTLEFGVNLSANAGIPYIAGGKAESNLKITVKCTYPKVGEAIAPNGQSQSAQPQSIN
jgi:Trypsin-co-occurring domain 1